MFQFCQIEKTILCPVKIKKREKLVDFIKTNHMNKLDIDINELQEKITFQLLIEDLASSDYNFSVVNFGHNSVMENKNKVEEYYIIKHIFYSLENNIHTELFNELFKNIYFKLRSR